MHVGRREYLQGRHACGAFSRDGMFVQVPGELSEEISAIYVHRYVCMLRVFGSWDAAEAEEGVGSGTE